MILEVLLRRGDTLECHNARLRHFQDFIHEIKVHPPNLQQEAESGDPVEEVVLLGRVCASCGYDLDRLEGEAVCPECGRKFDRSDPSSTMSRRMYRWRAAIRGRWGLSIALLILVITGARHGVLPAPVRWGDPRLWNWFGRDYGLLQVNMTQDEYQLAYRWAGYTQRIERWSRVDATGKPAQTRLWRASRKGPDQFELSVDVGGIPLRDLIGAVASVRRDEMLGVRVEFECLPANLVPFRAAGSKAEVLSEVIRRYVTSVRPFKLETEQDHVWVFDETEQRLKSVTVAEAEARGLGPIQTRTMWEEPRFSGQPLRALKPSGGAPLTSP